MIEWAEGTVEEVPVSSFEAMESGWKPLAIRLGLRWAPLFASFLALTPDRIPDVISELLTLRTELTRKEVEYQQAIQAVSRLIEALDRLARCGGWKASIG